MNIHIYNMNFRAMWHGFPTVIGLDHSTGGTKVYIQDKF